MTATVDVITDKRSKAVAIPISAVVVKTDTSSAKISYGKTTEARPKNGKEEEKFECVFVNENGVAKLRVVKTGIQDDTNIEIISGLKEGDDIITGPYNMVSRTLKPGDKVEEKSETNNNDDNPVM